MYLVPGVIAAMLGLLIWQIININLLLSWLIAINLVTFLVYAYDKAQAKRKAWRVSERELLVLALIGGSLGALSGMYIFRHKTAKRSFQVRLLIILLVQIALILIYFLVV
jgi:uncharacterized membrane protein YsdA (DUF1294 family)